MYSAWTINGQYGNYPFFPFFWWIGTQNFAIHIFVVLYFHAIFFHVRIMLSSVVTKKLGIQDTFSSPKFSDEWRNRSWKVTHLCEFAVFNGRQQVPFQKSQIHNPKHSQYKARVKTSSIYISKKIPAYGKLSQACGEMKSPIGGSKHIGNMPHSPHLPCGEGL